VTRPSDRAPRIVFSLHHHLDPNSGAAGLTLHLGDAYRVRGCDVSYVSHENLPPWLPSRWRIVFFPVYVFFRYTVDVVSGTVDIVDAMTGDAWLLSLIPRRFRQATLVCRSHGLEHVSSERRRAHLLQNGSTPSKKDEWFWWGYQLQVISLGLRRSDIAVFSNPADADYAVDRLGCDRARVQIVANGVSDAVLAAARSVTREHNQRTRQICFVGTWSERKGKDDVPTILQEVVQSWPDIRLLVVGSLIDQAEVLEAFPDALRPFVEVVPHYENAELPSLVRNAEILVFPSRHEGYPVSVVEAMACGLVPVSYNVDGPADIIRAGDVGRIVPPGDINAFATAVSQLLGLSESEFGGLSATAQAWGQSQTWPHIAEGQLAFYSHDLLRRDPDMAMRLSPGVSRPGGPT
jgi:glycosyltransferase involved in cell wall biosynthesis